MEEQKEEQEVKEQKTSEKIAVIRVRGSVKLRKEFKDTLNMLKLFRKNYCVILSTTPSVMGMVKKVASYITWGDVDDETLKLLKEKRQEKTKDKKGKEAVKPFFRLHPPKKGFGRKGIKVPFKVGGALGDRKEKINDLIKRMMPTKLVPNSQEKKIDNKEGRA